MADQIWDGYIYDKTVFRLLGDAAHVCSKFVLIYTIHRYKSAEGISFLTQMLYLNVFLFRYVDLFDVLLGAPASAYNTTLKILYIATSIYTLYLMLRKYPRSREGEREWIVSAWIYVISVVGGLLGIAIVHWQFKEVRFDTWGFESILRCTSLAMEALHLLPQLSLLSSISTPTAITSYYLLLLGSYRALYLLNWIQRWVMEGWKDPVAAFWGIIQTYVYLEFAWVYWRRQKIKLRAAGGVLDSEDWVNSGFILKYVFGHNKFGAKNSTGGSWRDWARGRLGRGGRGGVSVSADEESPDLFHNTGSYEDDAEDRDVEAGGNHRATGRGVNRNEGTEDEGRVLFGSDSDDEEEGAVAWQQARPLDAEGVVLQDSDDEDGGMTANEINDRRQS